MAKIIIERYHSFCGCLLSFDVYLQNTYVGKLKSGGELAIDVDVGSHTLLFKCRQKFGKSRDTSFLVVVNEPDEEIFVESGFGKDGDFFVSYTDTDNVPHTTAVPDPFANTCGTEKAKQTVNNKNNAVNKNSAHPFTSGLLSGFGSCIFLLALIVLIVNGCEKDDNTLTKNNISSSERTINVSKNNDNSEKGVILYSDDDFEIKYLTIYDPNTLFWYIMKFELTNRSDKNVLISLDEAYVNDYLTEISGGNVDFVGVAPGKKSVCTFYLDYDYTVIEKLDDIKKIEFKVKLKNADDRSDVLLKTETITINFR